jgi:DNA-binding NarL/FixJ family response regulator
VRPSDARQLPAAKFTTREKSVITLLKLGTSDKIIASELQMSESTVKVHIHNIMRKMNVRNRTEVVSRTLEEVHWLGLQPETEDR